MYKRITVPVDSSTCSGHAVDASVALAEKLGSHVNGVHVYASKLHDKAFRRMEEGLPEQYQEEDELTRQRRIHDSLIDKGLVLISESMLTDFSEKAAEKGVSADSKVIEGKNFSALLDYVKEDDSDLVVLGSQGLGQVNRSVIGSVCDRISRGADVDVLVLKKELPFQGAKVLVAIDGSPHSFSALKRVLALSKEFDLDVTAVHVFDPVFHAVAFEAISQVLTDEAAEVFKFEEQQKLHDEIIDRGLKKVGERHLEQARRIAQDEGVDLKITILSGKPYDRIIDLIEEEGFDLVVSGRHGTHRVPESKIGSHTYNILLSASCNHLIVSTVDDSVNAFQYHGSSTVTKSVSWTDEALERLNHVPPFVRGMVKKSVEEYAAEHGHEQVDAEVMDAARGRMGM